MISRSSLTTIIAAVVFVFASCNQIEVSEVALHDKDFVTIPVPEKPLHSVNNILEITDVAVIKPDPKISESFVSDLFSVKKILFIDSLYVLLDTKFSIANAYGKNGDYRYSFNKLGVGRGESSLLLDAVLAADQKQIFLVSNRPTKLMKFNQTGELLNETSLTFFPSSMVIPSADTYIYDVNYNYNKISKKNNLLFTDSLSQVKSRGVPLIKSKEDSTFSSPIDNAGLFTADNDSLYYNPGHTDLIYNIQQGAAFPAYYIRFPGTDSIPAKSGIDPQISNRNYGVSGNIIINNSYIGFNYFDRKGSKLFTAFYNLRTKELFQSSQVSATEPGGFAGGRLFQSGSKLMMLVKLNDFIAANKNNLPASVLSNLQTQKIDQASLAIVSFNLK